MSFDFSEKFQRSFLAALLRSPETAFTYRYIIEPSYFTTEGMSVICGALFDYLDKFHCLPRPSVLADKIRREIKKYVDDKRFETITLKLLKELYHIKISDIDYVCSLAANFAEEAEWKQTFIEAPDLIETGEFGALFDKCLQAREKGRVVLPYVLDRELDSRLERLEETVESGLIKTGIKHIDLHFNIYPPALGIIIGDSGKGKTWLLLDLTRAALRQGYNVLFITGEMSADDLSVRFDAGLLGINSSYFYEPSLHEKIKERLEKKYKEKLKGKLTIIEFSAGLYSVGELDADVRRFCLRKDDAPTLVCVDFMDLLTYRDSARRGMSGWEEQVMISRALRGTAHSNKIMMWAAGTMHTKRIDGDKRLATRADKSGAGDVVYSTDFYWVLNQSPKDAERGRVLILADKTRKGESGWIIGVKTGFHKSRFCADSQGAIRKSTFDAKREKKKG